MPIIKNRKLYVDGWDFSGDTRALELEMTPELKDDTVLGDGFRSNVPGLEPWVLQEEGLWVAGANQVDANVAANRGLVDKLVTVACVDGTEGDIAYFGRSTVGLYTLGGEVGELNPFSLRLEGTGSDRLVRGTILVTGAKTATGNSTAQQLGAVAAGESLFAGLHVIAVAGTSPTLDVIVQSDTVGFPSSTNRITFAQQIAIGSVYATPVAGAITDDYWRINYTIGGTGGPSFTFLVTVGIQTP